MHLLDVRSPRIFLSWLRKLVVCCSSGWPSNCLSSRHSRDDAPDRPAAPATPGRPAAHECRAALGNPAPAAAIALCTSGPPESQACSLQATLTPFLAVSRLPAAGAIDDGSLAVIKDPTAGRRAQQGPGPAARSAHGRPGGFRRPAALLACSSFAGKVLSRPVGQRRNGCRAAAVAAAQPHRRRAAHSNAVCCLHICNPFCRQAWRSHLQTSWSA